MWFGKTKELEQVSRPSTHCDYPGTARGGNEKNGDEEKKTRSDNLKGNGLALTKKKREQGKKRRDMGHPVSGLQGLNRKNQIRSERNKKRTKPPKNNHKKKLGTIT